MIWFTAPVVTVRYLHIASHDNWVNTASRRRRCNVNARFQQLDIAVPSGGGLQKLVPVVTGIREAQVR